MEKIKRIKNYSSFLELSSVLFHITKNVIDKQLYRSLEEKENKVVKFHLARFYYFYSACHIPLLIQADLQTNSDVRRRK